MIQILFRGGCQAKVVGAALLMAFSLSVTAGGACGVHGEDDEQALALGRQVLAVQEVLREPSGPDAMEIVVALGTDSRYYTLVRGWLALQLQGDQSILRASEAGERPELEARVDFLHRAIRAIDLE